MNTNETKVRCRILHLDGFTQVERLQQRQAIHETLVRSMQTMCTALPTMQLKSQQTALEVRTLFDRFVPCARIVRTIVERETRCSVRNNHIMRVISIMCSIFRLQIDVETIMQVSREYVSMHGLDQATADCLGRLWLDSSVQDAWNDHSRLQITDSTKLYVNDGAIVRIV